MVCGRFTRQHRLLTPKDFNYVFAKPVKQSDKHLTLLARSNNFSFGRLGLIVPKRQIKSAVKRNRVKRLIRESFRCHQDHLQGLDVVVLVRGGFAGLSNETIFSLLDKHWSSLSKKCANSLFL
ncbi:MAG: ribonuclease P protein component [Gammaproteobacteria bacterium]|nr:ribonuclease P protein component [Gammaproteobacteria bacterium]